jgi:alkaline phosphatase D
VRAGSAARPGARLRHRPVPPRDTRNIVIECWPRSADPAYRTAKQYPGWPVVIDQMDNYGRQPAGVLPRIDVVGMNEPVIQIVHEATGEIVYTIRIAGAAFRPKVFAPGKYTVRIGEPGTDTMKEVFGLKMRPVDDDSSIIVRLDTKDGD